MDIIPFWLFSLTWYAMPLFSGNTPFTLWPLLSTIGHSLTSVIELCLFAECVSSAQFRSGAQSYPNLRGQMDSSTPGFPVHHQHPELAQTHVQSQWCYPTISSSVVPFSYCLQSFKPSGSFLMSQFFTSGGQSWSFSVSPSNEYSGLSTLGLTGLIFLQTKGHSRFLLQHHSSKTSILQCSAFFMVQISHQYMTTEKNRSFD